jgi:hypothetical protein
VTEPDKAAAAAAAARTGVDETTARQVVLMRAYETEPAGAAPGRDNPVWTQADREWATRLASESMPAPASPARYVSERARHVAQRLRARDPAVGRWLDQRLAFGRWALLAALLGLLAGLAVDQIGPAQQINLLDPPIWLIVSWNLLVYAAIGVSAIAGVLTRPPSKGGVVAGPARSVRAGPRAWIDSLYRLLPRLWERGVRNAGGGPLSRCALTWSQRSMPLNSARAALLLHLGAAALAVGVVASLYLHGLVLDYRAGWQSTFLEADTVHAVLSTLLAPASHATGIAVPELSALSAARVSPGVPAHAPAAPWLHLYAATLGLLVVGPRLVLALLAAWRVRQRSRQWPLALGDPYFARLVRQGLQGDTTVAVLPHAAPVHPQVAASLRALLSQSLGERVQLHLSEPVPYGDEDSPDADGRAPPAGTSLRLALFDLGTTPEEEVHGRMLDSLASLDALDTLDAQSSQSLQTPQTPGPGAPPVLVLVDESTLAQRLSAQPERLDARRRLWADLAAQHGLRMLSLDLHHPPAGAEKAFDAALTRALA